MQREYQELIFTNHALERLERRKISQGDAYAAFKQGRAIKSAETKGAYVYTKQFERRMIEVVAKKNEKGEWLVLSVWDKTAISNKSQATKHKKHESMMRKSLRILKKVIIG